MSEATTQPEATETPTTTPDTPAPEAPKTEAAPSPKTDPTAASRFAIAAKREKEAQRRVQELKSKEADIDRRLKALEEREGRIAAIRQNPLAALDEAGVPIDPQTKALMAQFLQNSDSPDAKLAALNKRLETMAQQLAERDQQAEEQRRQAAEAERGRAVTGYRNQLAGYAKQNAEAYEWAATFDADGAVAYEVAEAMYRQSVDDGDPQMPDAKVVMDKVEAYFEGQFSKIAESKKFAAKFGGKFAPKAPAPPTTITQGMAQGSSANGAALTDMERMRRALAHLDAQKT